MSTHDQIREYTLSRYKVRDLPERSRPREQAATVGLANVSDAAVLAIVLRSGTQGRNVIDLAEDLLNRYGSLTALARTSVAELAKEHGMGPVKAQALHASLELARRVAEEGGGGRITIRTPEDVASVLRAEARVLDHEVFWVLPLDTKYALKQKPRRVSEGILDGSLVHAREVFACAVESRSAAIVAAHNHPSGDPTPSSEDVRITKKLVEAGKTMDIEVLDHVILGRRDDGRDEDFFSMRESGLVEF